MIPEVGNRMIVVRRWHLAVLAILLLTALLRFPGIGEKPLHHDESIHAFYSLKLSHGGEYKYDPVYHGPFMYYANALSFFLFGETDTAARIMPAAFGTGTVALILMLAPWIGRVAAGSAALLAALSPSLVHVSRFAREDSFFAFFTLAVIVFFLRYERWGRSVDLVLSGAALGLVFATKESSYLFAFLAVAFLFARHPRRIIGFWRHRPLVPALAGLLLLAGLAGTLVTREESSLIAAFGVAALVLVMAPLAAGLARPRDAIRAALAFLAVWVLFFSSLFTNPKGILGGVFAALDYWAGQQSAPRIPGPWWYYLPRFTLYEGLLVIGFLLSIPRLAKAGPLGRFLLWWAGSSILIYGIAQEKVPWLLTHQVLPMAICAGVAWGAAVTGRRRVPAIVLGALLLLFTLHNAIGLAFFRGADPREAMVYVQTHADVTKVMALIEEYDFRHGNDKKTPVTVEGAATWPFAWYLRDWPAGYPGTANLTNPSPIIIAAAEREGELRRELAGRYFIHRYRLRAWWIPDFTKDSVKAWVRYALLKELFSPVGSTDFILCLENDAVAADGAAGAGPGEPPAPPEPLPVAVRPEVVYDTLGLSGPRDLAVGGGFIYVADTDNNRVLRLDPAGKVTQVIGEGLKGATGLAAGPDWLAVADTWNHRVVIYGPQGKQLRILGPDDGKGTPLFGPRDVARVGDRWYVVDTGGRRVVVYGDDGRPAGSWGKEGDGMIEPVGVAAEASGKLLIADTGNRRVRLTDTAGKQLAAWPVSGWSEYFTEPYLAVLPDRRLVVSDSSSGTLQIFSAAGILEKKLSLDPALGPWKPEGVAVGPGGKLWVADRQGNRIVVLAAEALR